MKKSFLFIVFILGLITCKKEPEHVVTSPPKQILLIDSNQSWTDLKTKFIHHRLGKKLNGKDTTFEQILANQVLIEVQYWGFDSQIHQGQLICNQAVAVDLQNIFKDLLAIQFPVKSVIPISEFGFDDLQSMQANNTNCFDYRLKILGNGLSKHAHGLAIDINPMQNPYIHPTKTEPKNNESHTSKGRIRNKEEMGKKVIKIFKKYGWKWGGNWKSAKDYMHFEKNN